MLVKDVKFKVEGFTQVGTTKAQKKYCYLNVMKAAFTDAGGEKIGDDDFFQIYVSETKFKEIDGLNVGDIITCSFFMNGSINSKDDRNYHNINLSLFKITRS